MISPYVAAGTEEKAEIGFTTVWNDPSEVSATMIIHLLYADLGKRRHSVRMHLVIAKNTNYDYGGAKQLTPRLFMVKRETTVVEQTFQGRMQRQLNKLRVWWQENTVDRWEI